MKKHILSKSTFLRGLKCEKSLYLYKNNNEFPDALYPQQEAIFSQGNTVGELAQQLFPNGVDASPPSHFEMQKSVIKTQEYIDRGETIIYEATFQFNEVLVALDILVKENAVWKAYEVKSSTSVKEVYVQDASIQYYVIQNSGIELDDISIVHINNQYVKNGEINVQELFSINSVFDDIQPILPGIPNQIQHLKNVIRQDSVPDIDIGPQCSSPYTCDFMGHCWKHIPEYSIFNIAGLWANKKFDLYSQGILTFEQIDLSNNPLNGNQLLQVTSELENTTYINKEKINQFVSKLEYPLYFLDFETINPAIPIYDNSRPYQQLVFQYSLHVQNRGGEIKHFEFLAEANPDIDPRIDFVKQLIHNCGNEGDVIVYNIGFEKGKLNDLATLYPEYATELNDIIDRLVDLMIPFQKKWYYTPEMKGSYSIKAVLPALVPELSYQNLEIKEGGTASSTFVQIVNGEFEGDIEKTRTDLLEYCKMDTYAMVKILEKLKKL